MTRWHYVAMFFVTSVVPASLLALSLFVMTAAIYNAQTEGLDEWGEPIVLGAAVSIGAALLLYFLNKRARRRWREHLDPVEDEAS